MGSPLVVAIFWLVCASIHLLGLYNSSGFFVMSMLKPSWCFNANLDTFSSCICKVWRQLPLAQIYRRRSGGSLNSVCKSVELKHGIGLLKTRDLRFTAYAWWSLKVFIKTPNTCAGFNSQEKILVLHLDLSSLADGKWMGQMISPKRLKWNGRGRGVHSKGWCPHSIQLSMPSIHLYYSFHPGIKTCESHAQPYLQ